MTLAEAENLAFEILKQVMEEKINNVNVEVASVTEKVRALCAAACVCGATGV
jgi:ATP-dependent RNA circularization protein (DNA/RNA ligase family)